MYMLDLLNITINCCMRKYYILVVYGGGITLL